MADEFKPCSVPGCNGNAAGSAGGCRGWCNSHYLRNKRHGSPTAGRVKNGEPIRWLLSAIKEKHEGCLYWPFGRNAYGYGRVYYNGKAYPVTRLICELVYGPPHGDGYQCHAAHSCGNGHLGCCNPAHLRWATVTENAFDKAIHGTMVAGDTHPFAKLTSADVKKIRSLKGAVSQRRMAAMFGVSEVTISDIFTGRSWAHVR